MISYSTKTESLGKVTECPPFIIFNEYIRILQVNWMNWCTINVLYYLSIIRYRFICIRAISPTPSIFSFIYFSKHFTLYNKVVLHNDVLVYTWQTMLDTHVGSGLISQVQSEVFSVGDPEREKKRQVRNYWSSQTNRFA